MCSQLDVNNILDIVLQEIYKESIEICYTNNFKQYCYLIFAGLIIDYKKQVLIISIKANMHSLFAMFYQKKEIKSQNY